MSGDYSRKTFEPRDNFSGVHMQQGRVQLDADWNEQSAIQDRRWRAETVDIIGRCGFPKETPDAFLISIVGGALQIGPGRMYVDGLLAENHGGPPLTFNATLAESTGTSAVPFLAQPYIPDTSGLLPEAAGTALAYLDVWNREVTYLEDPELLEKAVGVDTTTRQQTVWQVRLLDDVGAIDCSTDDAAIPGWLDIITPSGGRLSSEAVGVPEPTDPCFIPAIGGYKGLENRLYRVQIHDGGDPGPATFKWSRYNGTVATRVTAIPDLDTLRVERVRRDDLLRFNAGDWVEVIDDQLELAGLPGIIRRIDNVDDGTNTITLRDDLTAGQFPTDAQGQTLPGRHTRVRRWDQSGVVRDTGGTILADLDDPTSTGVIPVPPDGTSVVLEDGVQVTFDSDAAGAPVRTGDYWCIAARVIDGSVDELDTAPPVGIHHHFCRLAVVEFDGDDFFGDPIDCRICYPPPDEGAGCCTVVVEPGEDIQAALDSLPDEGGCVCIKTGLHIVEAELRIRGSNIVMHGESPGAIIRRENGITVLDIRSDTGASLDRISIDGIRFETGVGDDDGSAIVFTNRIRDFAIRDCTMTPDQFTFIAGIRIGGMIGGIVERCTIGPVLYGVFVDTDSTALDIVENRIFGEFLDGIDFGFIGIWMEDAFGASRIERNEIDNFQSGIYINRNGFTEVPSSGASGTHVIGNTVNRSRNTGSPGSELRIFGIDVAAFNCLIRDNVVNHNSAIYGGIRTTGPQTVVESNRLISGFVPGSIGDEIFVPIGIQLGFGGEEEITRGRDTTLADNLLIGHQDAIIVVQTSDANVCGNRIIGANFDPRIGISIADSDGSKVNENRVENSLGALIMFDGENNSAFGNCFDGGGFGILVSDQTSMTLASNDVLNMSLGGIAAATLPGGTSIVDNRVRSCGFAATSNLGALGIAVLNATGNVRIESNEVIDTGVSADQTQIRQPAFGILVLVAVECSVHANQVAYTNVTVEGRDLNAEDRALWMIGFIEFQVTDNVILGGPALVTDNKFTGPGFSALVEFQQFDISDNIRIRFERVTFSNNHCWHWSVANDAAATVSLRARRSIVMGNHIKALTNVNSFNFNGTTGTYIGNDAQGPVVGFTEFPTPSSNFNR